MDWEEKNKKQQLSMNKKIVLLSLLILVFIFYWFAWRPTQIIKECHQARLNEIEKRHKENLNYYFVPSTGIPDLDKDIDAGKNKPMYVKDENAKLDNYWGDIAFRNCLNENGLRE